MVSPYLGEFELLGDSQLLRFADKILGLGYLISKTSMYLIKTYTGGRPDLIHLNESGLLRLLHLLKPFL
ncbi:signal recognition particle 54k protein srp54 [Holotrichia oblita]|uniref:Uncharacterized protein n=3 Tax=Holotrichia oblita TaxID=644536 RepID=A0ACB9TER7_HOLOL|nr:hypothetical protein MML48_3g00003488 [Holotrichia oblita]KAI4470859.1 hypothetical protein MML48_1g16813 [Holotrichia oblita]KAI4470868.1 signal recognition particle 54k protein srp54 [Holotrichia oblita]